MEEKKEMLYMPQGIKSRREYFNGYGKKEFIQTLVSCILSSFISFGIYLLFGNQIVAILIFLIIPTTTVALVVKNDSNISVCDQIRFMYSFMREQKKYPYRAKNEWE